MQEPIKRIVEALLFSSSTPLKAEKLQKIIQTFHEVSLRDIRRALSELACEYKEYNRSFELIEKASGYCLRTLSSFSCFVELLKGKGKRLKLSRAATEVLAIVAYSEPITRAGVEKIRGVDCSEPISTLLEMGFIEIKGHLNTPGKPPQYGPTAKFLDHFGLKSVKELDPRN